MTFSIVARSADGAQLGVAVASKFLAVGAAVPTAEAGVGAVATQSYANLAYRPDGLRLLQEGRTADQVVDTLTAADDKRDQRQVGVVGMTGDGATYTGSACHAWAGGRTGDGFAVQGNILTGPAVVDSMVEAFTAAAGPLSRRLLAALEAGDEAGGDRRGRQSSALLVVSPGGGYGGGSDVLVDLRVDDHAGPVPELTRLLDLHDVYFTKPDPADRIPLEGALLAEVRDRLSRVGHQPAGPDAASVVTALTDWGGIENLEERIDGSQTIDRVVLAMLRQKAGAAE
jgi:uncharacterized Ntn-hydrolase superfamily protein